MLPKGDNTTVFRYSYEYADVIEESVNKLAYYLFRSITGGTYEERLVCGAEAHVAFKSFLIKLIGAPGTNRDKIIRAVDYSHHVHGSLISIFENYGYGYLFNELRTHLEGFAVDARALIMLHNTGYRLNCPSVIGETTGIDLYAINSEGVRHAVYIMSSQQEPGVNDRVYDPRTYEECCRNSLFQEKGGRTDGLVEEEQIVLVSASRNKIELTEFID